MRKILVIGLDGATWDLIKPLAEEGKLPTFKKLLDEGAHGNLLSTLPIWTIPAWNCMLTGKNPGKLGIFAMRQKDHSGYKFKIYYLINKPERNSIIDIISENGKIACSINLPTIHSAYKIEGCMVAGWLHFPNSPIAYPEKLKSELDKITNGYEIDVYSDVDVLNWQTKVTENKKEFLKRLYQITEKRAKATEYLLNRYDWNFFMTVFEGTDRIQHKLWENKNEIERYYQFVDEKIAKLLEKINHETTTTILVSDHGFGHQSRAFNINDWLIEKGFLRLLMLENYEGVSKKRKILKKLKLWYLGKCLLPRSLRKRVGSGLDVIDFDKADIDWSKTKAYSGFGSGEIYINLKGREPKGIVEPGEEYDKLRDMIIKELGELKRKVNVPVKIFKKEQLYSRDYIENAPDLVIQLDDNIPAINISIGHESIFSKSHGGSHRMDGIFLAYGQEIKCIKIQDIKIYDVAPTILHMIGVPIPNDMDGRILKEIFKEDSEIAKRPIKYQKLDGKRSIKGKIRNLKALGKL